MFGRRSPASVQAVLMDLETIRDDVLVLRGGDTRAVIAVTGLNLSLKSPEEQDAIVNGYRAFLNSLSGPVQIVCAIGPRHLESYLEQIQAGFHTHRSATLARLALDHVAFVQQLARRRALMQRRFYLVLSGPSLRGSTGPARLLPLPRRGANARAADQESFLSARQQLTARAEEVCQALHGLGLGAHRLVGDELAQAIAEVLAPGRASRQRVQDTAAVTRPVVRARLNGEVQHAAS